MAQIVKRGAGLLYMKVGNHAQESLTDIIRRKTAEITQAGYALWGYGGNTCHPLKVVQPFAKSYAQRGEVIYLCMQPMDSKHFAEPVRAKEFSGDGLHWEEIPPSINVLGSRYALTVADLRPEEFDLPLARTRVALGTCQGRLGSDYVAGRVDKACLEVLGEEAVEPDDRSVVHIGLVARIVEPYAVFVRN
ncbi:MAG TPA: hypothetical protein VMW80_04020 [Candidatus Dormibacteraeota bacterium]|nr:hypothetical protein [Candidatus Dormibacteraeota bacterium]